MNEWTSLISNVSVYSLIIGDGDSQTIAESSASASTRTPRGILSSQTPPRNTPVNSDFNSVTRSGNIRNLYPRGNSDGQIMTQHRSQGQGTPTTPQLPPRYTGGSQREGGVNTYASSPFSQRYFALNIPYNQQFIKIYITREEQFILYVMSNTYFLWWAIKITWNKKFIIHVVSSLCSM